VSHTTILLLSVDEAHNLAYSLPAAVIQPGAEVWVIDNGCTDGTPDVAREHDAFVLRLNERVSYAEAMNRAIAHTKGDAVLFLNADCFLDPDFLERARPLLDGDGVGSVAPRLLQTPGATEPAGPIDAAGMVVDRRRKNGLVGHGSRADAFGRSGECFGADGACALYRREVLERCTLGEGEVFDEVLGLWASDADLAWRARLLGWRCVYAPDAVARHVRTYSPSKRNEVAEAHRRLQFRNRYLMWFKNETRGGLLRDLPFIAGYEVAALGHVLLRERHLLRGYREVWQALPAMRARRRAVQERRVVKRVPFGLSPEP
jgi:GT2 family glycosyltransferase